MAPIAAGTAGSKQTTVRRALPRIVPAIPHRLSRTIPSARPVTPEESNKGAVNQPGREPQAAEKQTEEQQPPITVAEAPLTPDSRVSVANKSEEAAPGLSSSPPKSTDIPVEHAADSQDFTTTQSNGNPSDQTSHSLEPKPATNGAQRKMAVRAELPPPFYPSNRQDNPNFPAIVSESAHNHLQNGQLGAGTGSTNAVNDPAVLADHLQEIDIHGHHQRFSMPRPPPGFAPPEFTPSFFPGHSHHPSATGGQWPYPSQSVAPPEAVYANGADFQSPAFPPGLTAYASHHNGTLPTSAVNGVATSSSQSPIKTQFGERKTGSEHEEDHRTLPYQNGSTFQSDRLEESPFELAAYLSSQFGNPEFADFGLQIRSSDSLFVSLPVHGIVVVRSPKIAEAVRRSVPPTHRSRDARRLLDVLIADPYVTRESLEEAVKVLYGAPLLSAQTFLFGVAPYAYDSDQSSASDDARRRMRQLLSYIAAGKALQIPSMQVRGVEIVRSLLRWDTVDLVLQFALQSMSLARSQKDGSDPEDPFTAGLLNYAIDFMAFTFPVDFQLYNIAPELQELPRLPGHAESRPPTHSSRLSKIRFGDAPAEGEVQPTHAQRILSSLLLSLPLPLLDRLFNHRATANQIGWTGSSRIMREVINEREHRRRKAAAAHTNASHDGLTSGGPLNNVFVEERVEQVEPSPHFPSGYRLAAGHTPGEVLA